MVIRYFLKIAVPLAVAVLGIFFWFFAKIMAKKNLEKSKNAFSRQFMQVVVALVTVTLLIATVPVSENLRGQLLSFWGILLSAALALSATTFIGNLLAGIMLQSIKNFNTGDFIEVDGYFGRISEKGIFHVEIQTEESRLVTLSNLMLVTRPVTVLRASGTIVSASVSLGYDANRRTITAALREAAESLSLQEPFVHITKLGDFSVTYRIAGLLTDVKKIISTRAALNAAVLDSLHSRKIEIVSPAFMNQRQVPAGKQFIPSRISDHAETQDASPEQIIFAKAEKAESTASLEESLTNLRQRLEQLKKSVPPENLSDSRIGQVEKWIALVEQKIAANRKEMDSD